MLLEAQTTTGTGGSHRPHTCPCCSCRHGERVVSCPRAIQHLCHRLQPLERQLLRLAQVGTVELPIALAIRPPVRPPALVACPLFASGEGAVFTANGEGGGGLEPVIPAGSAYHQLSGLLVLLVDKRLTLDNRRCLSHLALPLVPW